MQTTRRIEGDAIVRVYFPEIAWKSGMGQYRNRTAGRSVRSVRNGALFGRRGQVNEDQQDTDVRIHGIRSIPAWSKADVYGVERA